MIRAGGQSDPHVRRDSGPRVRFARTWGTARPIHAAGVEHLAAVRDLARRARDGQVDERADGVRRPTGTGGADIGRVEVVVSGLRQDKVTGFPVGGGRNRQRGL